jgi:hypothetical protein
MTTIRRVGSLLAVTALVWGCGSTTPPAPTPSPVASAAPSAFVPGTPGASPGAHRGDQSGNGLSGVQRIEDHPIHPRT